MTPAKLSYRPEIDGLRAIAVTIVIFYHAKMVLFSKDWFEGGFIGVDIFFVISGYLITRIILIELQTTGSMSFLNFYERRARRILPMLFLVIFVSAPFAWQKLLPSGLIEYSESLIASLLFGSNFFFYFSTTEYGADSSLLKPFLHTWSLGVEEQFYLAFPILAIMIHRFFKDHFLTILVALSLISLQFADLMAVKNPDLNFFLPFSRFWELAVGSILAYRELNYKTKNDSFGRRTLPIVGLYMIVHSILFFDHKTPHPSFQTIIPIIGVALIIGFSSRDELVGKLLGSKPLVRMGLISYSAYLWHFPIFAFNRIDTTEPDNYSKLGLIAVTILLSLLSYQLVEKPFRNRNIISTRLFYQLTVFFIILVIAFSVLTIKRDGFPSRVPQGWINFELDGRILRKGLAKFFHDEKAELLQLPSSDKINVYIFGNSHAADFITALLNNRDQYEKFHFLKVRQIEQLACFDERDSRFEPERNKLYNSQAYQKSDLFIIASAFIDSNCVSSTKDQPSDADGLRFLIPKLKADGKKVLILGNTLVLNRIDGKWLAEYIFAKATEGDIDFNSHEVFTSYKKLAEQRAYEIQSDRNHITNDRLRKFASENQLDYFDRKKLFCDTNSKSCLTFTEDGHRFRWDYGHLTIEGQKVFGEILLQAGFEKTLLSIFEKQTTVDVTYSPYIGSMNNLVGNISVDQ
jgi:peptidoglycan/LPS O-acetylase OafA/YrhL